MLWLAGLTHRSCAMLDAKACGEAKWNVVCSQRKQRAGGRVSSQQCGPANLCRCARELRPRTRGTASCRTQQVARHPCYQGAQTCVAQAVSAFFTSVRTGNEKRDATRTSAV